MPKIDQHKWAFQGLRGARVYMDEHETGLLLILKTGHKDESGDCLYFVVQEDAFFMDTGKIQLMSEQAIIQTYNITLTED